ncbi:hypothetical protein CC80DRAFT_495563 [Byssothecium circinans]|uniref:DUF4267 domain-containing protein n=1 Tax=Byssothecium circinans TaxID=147558 RepID=A0A6A5TIN5_9PLEO|nr:hypothetical protein CC80DRAFT_495563 [Byssothecium circinans]
MSTFHPRHIPALLIATSTSIGGLLPLFNAPSAMRSFGLPDRIANSPTAHSPFVLYGSRISAMGVLVFAAYARGDYVAVDFILALMGVFFGPVDVFVCWREGVGGKALFRGVSCAVVGA